MDNDTPSNNDDNNDTISSINNDKNETPSCNIDNADALSNSIDNEVPSSNNNNAIDVDSSNNYCNENDENNYNDDTPNTNINDNDDDDEVGAVDDDFVRKKQNRRSRCDLSCLEIEQVISFIIERSTLKSTTTTSTTADNTTTADLYIPKRGTLTLAGIIFNTTQQNISRIWKQAVINKCNPNINDYIVTKKSRGNKIGKFKWDREELINELKKIPIEQRTSIRSMSKSLGNIPHGTLLRILKEGYIRCYYINNDDTSDNASAPDNNVLPILNEEIMLQRIYYCYNRIHKLVDNDNHNIKQRLHYDDRYNEIHIAEQWFYMKKINHDKIYLTKDEPDPLPAPKRTRHNQQHEGNDDNDNNNYNNKVMFIMAVARPLFDYDGNCIFDGKIGIWPFILEEQQELREFIPVKDVTTNLYLHYMKYKVIPAIKQYYSYNRQKSMKIYIQHDNNTSPIPDLNLNTNIEWIDFCHNEEIHNNKWSFIINDQPPNSPDVNVCQLGFFETIQKLQYKKKKHQLRNVTTLINNVISSWNTYDPMTLSKTWYQHSEILNYILNDDGNNEYYNDLQEETTINNVIPKIVYVNDDAIETLERFQLYNIQSGELI